MSQAPAASEPTPYPDVNAVLDKLLAGAQAALGARFVGMYLYGSLAAGDFNPASSDVDFVVVTEGEIPQETVDALAALHVQLAASGLKWADKLEGAYVPKATLRRHRADSAPCPQFNEGRFFIAPLGSDWIIQRDVLYREGVTLAGPPPQTLIDPVSPDEVREAVLRIFHEWWEPMLDDPSWLERDDYRAYAVLSMCRVLYTLQFGVVASKPVSAGWAQQAVEGEHIALIAEALRWHHDLPFDHLNTTIVFIRYTQREVAAFESEQDDD